MNIDLTSITVAQFVTVLVGIAFVDTIAGVLSALLTHTFTWAAFPNFLVTHVLQRIFPIAGLVLISQVLPADTAAAAHQAIWALALVGLAGYVVETVQSLAQSLNPPTGLTIASSGPKPI